MSTLQTKSHAASIEKSSRLKSLLSALQSRCMATTAELQKLTESMAVHTDVHELRQNGYKITCKFTGWNSQGRKVHAYKLEGVV